jgi:hypothetical protein
MFRFKFVFLCALLLCLAGGAFAQTLADTDATVVPLIVEKGVPLQVLLTDKLRFKVNESVHATIAEPVFSFDREVIPAGTKVEGTITGFESAGKWKRISAMLGGDFTPQREPQITFHTLVFADGTRLPIQTSALAGSEKVVGSDKQHDSDLKNSFTSSVKKPGKEELKNWAWGLAPFHPQYLPLGVRMSAVLLTPLDFGEAVLGKNALDQIGSELPADTVASVRLVTPLDSRTAQPGTPVEALLTRPLFSEDHKLVFPVGTRFQGNVTEVTSARALHHHGQLSFALTTIAAPSLWQLNAIEPQPIAASLVSVAVGHDMKNLRIKDGNTARIVESKTRFIAPAWAFISAGRSLNSTSHDFETALLDGYRSKFLKQVLGDTKPGFGLPATIAGSMVPPVHMGLGFYGAARSVYSTFLGRGRDINLPDNTAMEIRLGKR